jgi:hypothetical protein
MKEELVLSSDLAGGTRGTVELNLGRHLLRVERTETGGILRLLAVDGSQPLEIEVTAAGPVLRFGAPLTIAVEGALAIDADTISLRARSALNLVSDGTVSIHAGGELRSSAHAQDIRATLGDVRISANDDVVVDGERIKLNCS